MVPNPILKQLGLSEEDRVVIFHADDIGMNQASLTAYMELVSFGLISSASVMVPCAWFPSTADFCRSNKSDNIDMGIHLTLTSEWESTRWRPISTCDKASGLIDEENYFHHNTETVQKLANPLFVQFEIQAQVEQALSAGIDITHIDSHMGTLFHPKFLSSYVELVFKYHIPVFLLRIDEAHIREIGIDAETATFLFQQMQTLERQGLPMLDNIHILTQHPPENRLEWTKKALDSFPAGITYCIIHPSKDTPELRATTSGWEARVADYEVFMSKELSNYVKSSGLHVIGWRALRDLMRSTC